MNPYKARKAAKVIALLIVVALVVTSFSFIAFLPTAVGSAGSVAYGAESKEDLSASESAGTDQELSDELDFMAKFIRDIQKNFKDKVSYTELLDGAYQGIVESLDDPYSVYYRTQEEGDSLIQSVEGVFGGIGVSIENRNGQCVVVAPIPGTPAEEAGIQTGDVITKVDGVSLEGKTLSESAALLKGETGTEVSLTIQRDTQELNFTLTRATVRDVSVNGKMLDHQIGYLQITGFDSDTSTELANAKLKLINEGARALILDVRNNPGGLVTQAAKVADQFMEAGPIFHFEKQGEIVETVNASGQANSDIPLVLLVNGGSASASEILAGALKDTGRAVLIGTTTYGKGVAQQVVPLNNGASLKLSMYYFLTPNKFKLDHVGITPDIVVENYQSANQDELYQIYSEFAPMSEQVKPQAGDTGLNVYGAQQRLAFLGYSVTVTGTMDEASVNAVKEFQKSQGFHPYGVLDYSTMKALDSMAADHVIGADSGKDLQLEKAVEVLSVTK